MNKLKIVYFGTPYFSARFLEKLLTDTSIKHLIEVKLVVTQPDKPVGKNQILTTSTVKQIAKKYLIECFDQEVKNSKLKIKTLDFALIYAYGFKQLIPKNILELPRLKFGKTNSGFINIHPSLLPKYRGASPIAYPLMLGDKKTGVTLFVVDEKMDHGPIIAQEELQINLTDRRPELEVKLTDLGFELFKSVILNLFQELDSKQAIVLRKFRRARMTLIPQNHSQATHAHYLTKDDGFVPFSTLKKTVNNEPLTFEELPKIILEYINKYNLISNWKLEIRNSAKIIFNYFRSLHPWPGLWTLVKIKERNNRLKLTNLTISNQQPVRNATHSVAGGLTIKSVQLEGKKEVNFETFEKAYGIFKPFQPK